MFQSNLQKENETFIALCNCVQCTVEETVVRDEIIIGLKDNEVRQEARKR